MYTSSFCHNEGLKSARNKELPGLSYELTKKDTEKSRGQYNQTEIQSTSSIFIQSKLESSIFGPTASNIDVSRNQKMKNQDKGNKRKGDIPEPRTSKQLTKFLLESSWKFEPEHTPSIEGEFRKTKEEEDKEEQHLLKLLKMCSDIPWSHTEDPKEAKEKLKFPERKKNEGVENLETNVKRKVLVIGLEIESLLIYMGYSSFLKLGLAEVYF
ncbi:hypothetical protein H5410_032464 [Solanum commersonii]|uniref:Uncharacterized protein n=1 Tax=Solanum commersonii TaxID=4109 RepID=A0A9J5YQD2_SOLCO|nr:hypothetical protein H5410_032464 [Solanum commersonii]